MAEINRKASTFWNGDLGSGKGLINTESMALFEQPYSVQTRFGSELGTSPEELIAAAHAACFSMVLAGTLKRHGFKPEKTDTDATCTVASENGSHEIMSVQLHVRAQVPDIDETEFRKFVNEADQNCPVSNLLRSGLNIEIETTLLEMNKG